MHFQQILDRHAGGISKLSLAQLPTPLQPLSRLTAQLRSNNPNSPKIWVKRDDLSGQLLSGNKVRKLEYTLAYALDQGANAIITAGGVQSNHCRATAAACAQLGLRCDLILRGESPAIADGNLLLDKLLGAHLHTIPPRQYYDQLDNYVAELQSELTQQGLSPWYIPVGASDGYGVWGYLQAADELLDQASIQDIQLDACVMATGSGGTAAGLSLGMQLFAGNNVQVFAYNVCDDARYFEQKSRQDIQAWQALFDPEHHLEIDLANLPLHIVDGFVGEGYGKASRSVYRRIKQLAGLEGVVLDPVYTAKAFDGFSQHLLAGQYDHFENVVFMHTGGLFGVFPHRELLF
ncbi:MAG: D-cysteine desulfhydrase family protein [Pseudomonadales bacterium]|nr:D-cysteine desulfhydrase family protein [Pseudomonadales bacterium]